MAVPGGGGDVNHLSAFDTWGKVVLVDGRSVTVAISEFIFIRTNAAEILSTMLTRFCVDSSRCWWCCWCCCHRSQGFFIPHFHNPVAFHCWLPHQSSSSKSSSSSFGLRVCDNKCNGVIRSRLGPAKQSLTVWLELIAVGLRKPPHRLWLLRLLCLGV